MLGSAPNLVGESEKSFDSDRTCACTSSPITTSYSFISLLIKYSLPLIFPEISIAAFEIFQKAKQDRNYNNFDVSSPYIRYTSGGKVTVLGNPNLAQVKTLMIGVRNPKKKSMEESYSLHFPFSLMFLVYLKYNSVQHLKENLTLQHQKLKF